MGEWMGLQSPTRAMRKAVPRSASSIQASRTLLAALAACGVVSVLVVAACFVAWTRSYWTASTLTWRTATRSAGSVDYKELECASGAGGLSIERKHYQFFDQENLEHYGYYADHP